MSKSTLLLFTLFSFGVTLPAATAEASPARAKRALKKALRLVEDDDRGCRRKVAHDLEEVIEMVSRRRSVRKMRRGLRELEELVEEAEDRCGRRTVKALERAHKRLEAALDDHHDDRDDDDDDRARRRRRRRGDDDDSRSRRRACWNRNDPGCGHTRNGKGPMSRAAFNGLLKAVKASKPHVFQMVDQVKSITSHQYMTSMQLERLVPHFKPHVFQMLDVVKICAPRLVDPEHGASISAVFQPHVFQARDAAKIIAAQSAH